MAPVVEKVLDGFAATEGPHWDEKNQCVYFIDMVQNTIHKYIPSINKHTKSTLDQHATFLIPVKDRENEFVAAIERAIVLIHWDGEDETARVVKKIYEVGDDEQKAVFNDGKCDKTGRLWAGTRGLGESIETFPDKDGTLYSFQNNTIVTQRPEVGVSNGIAFDHNLNKMYYIDSLRWSLDAYDIDFEQGSISNVETVFHNELNGLSKYTNGLDGMTIDTDGNVWIAVYGTSRIYQIDPKTPETILQYVELPIKPVTSVTFGGPNLDELYVTSIQEPGVTSAALYRVTGLNVKGYPACEAVL